MARQPNLFPLPRTYEAVIESLQERLLGLDAKLSCALKNGHMNHAGDIKADIELITAILNDFNEEPQT